LPQFKHLQIPNENSQTPSLQCKLLKHHDLKKEQKKINFFNDKSI